MCGYYTSLVLFKRDTLKCPLERTMLHLLALYRNKYYCFILLSQDPFVQVVNKHSIHSAVSRRLHSHCILKNSGNLMLTAKTNQLLLLWFDLILNLMGFHKAVARLNIWVKTIQHLFVNLELKETSSFEPMSWLSPCKGITLTARTEEQISTVPVRLSLPLSNNTLAFCCFWSDNGGVLWVKGSFDQIKTAHLIHVRVTLCLPKLSQSAFWM